jgi:hypothetical protein
MKKIIFTAVLMAVSFMSIDAAMAAPYHHHRECHKVRVHHHWENRCH